MALFNNELHISRLDSLNIEVYKSTTFKYKGQWTVQGLVNVTGLETSKDGRNLFIFDFKEVGQNCEISRVDESCQLKNKWSTGDAWGALSATYDSNIILTDFPGSKLIEYSSDGTILRLVTISSAKIKNLRHAIKLSKEEYVICYGRLGHKDGTVCIFTVKGSAPVIEFDENDITNTFGNRIGLGLHTHMPGDTVQVPYFMVADKQGLIYVADKYNRRVLVLDSELNNKKVLISKKQCLQRPKVILLDEANDRMLVGDYYHILEHRLESQVNRYYPLTSD